MQAWSQHGSGGLRDQRDKATPHRPRHGAGTLVTASLRHPYTGLASTGLHHLWPCLEIPLLSLVWPVVALWRMDYSCKTVAGIDQCW